MGTLYIGGRKHSRNSGWKWKLSLFLILFSVVAFSALKVSAPFIVEKWINQKGAADTGYAFSVRDVTLALDEGEVVLNDVKFFHPKTHAEILKTPKLTVQLDWRNVLLEEGKKLTIAAEKMDLILSKDLSSEMERVQTSDVEMDNDLYLEVLKGKIAKLTVLEQKEGQVRTVLVLNDMNMKLDDASLHSVNEKTAFKLSSKVASGGTLKLSGKTNPENDNTSWTIQGSLKQVSADIFNKIAGNKLPFSFLESRLDAEINARSIKGAVTGEIKPQIEKLNLLKERAGYTQSITRALTEELTFTLPFTVKDEVTLQYEDTFKKLFTYRKYPVAPAKREAEEKPAPSEAVSKKSSFWTF